MLTGSTSTEEQNVAYRQMEHGARNGDKEIRVSSFSCKCMSTADTQLCYVTVRESGSVGASLITAARKDRQIEALHVHPREGQRSGAVE